MEQLGELTICIATRNRPDNLMQCLKSLFLLSKLNLELIIFDDASDSALDINEITQSINFVKNTKIIRSEENKGCITARNQMVEQASYSYILSLDDDAKLLKPDGIYQALEILKSDSKIGAVALSQAKEDGTLLADYMQPTPILSDCYAQSFIGYGHILRRDIFLKLGGYRELFQAFGEESEYCKRMLNIGFKVVFLPEAKVIHYHSPTGRNELKRLRYGCRNKCFDAIYNEPLPMMLISVPLRLINYIRWRKIPCEYYNFSDRGGLRWLLKELITNFIRIWCDRRPLKWSTYYQWYQIRKEWPLYTQEKFSKENT